MASIPTSIQTPALPTYEENANLIVERVGSNVYNWLGNFCIRHAQLEERLAEAKNGYQGFLDKKNHSLYVCNQIGKEKLSQLCDLAGVILSEYIIIEKSSESWLALAKQQIESWQKELDDLYEEKAMILAHLADAEKAEQNYPILSALSTLYFQTMQHVVEFSQEDPEVGSWKGFDALVKTSLYSNGGKISPPSAWLVSDSPLVKALVYKNVFNEIQDSGIQLMRVE